MVYDSTYKHFTTHNDLASLKDTKVNFQEDPIVALVCPVCIPKEGPDGKMEAADPVVRSLQHFVLVINATLVLEAVFAGIKASNFEDGEWDDWVKPLLKDTAVFSSLLNYKGGQNNIVYITTANYFAKIGFVTALPKKIMINSLGSLTGPFNTTIWFFILLSCVGLMLTLQVISHWKNKLSAIRVRRWAWDVVVKRDCIKNVRSSFMRLLTFVSILQPLIDQAASGRIIETTTRFDMNRCLVGMWLLLLIALGGAYKSKMIEMVVLPRYTRPPNTFEELADSEYKIGALVYGIVQPELQTLNNTMSSRIQHRAIEDDYFEPT
ncbi:unnamed protein product, partial [Allacma fusca]